MKREVSSRTSFYDDDVHRHNVSSLPPQIDCHLCWDNSPQHHGSTSSVKDVSEHALLLYSSNIGYIVHTPPPPPPPSVVCYCSSCCSTFRYAYFFKVFFQGTRIPLKMTIKNHFGFWLRDFDQCVLPSRGFLTKWAEILQKFLSQWFSKSLQKYLKIFQKCDEKSFWYHRYFFAMVLKLVRKSKKARNNVFFND